MSGTANPYNIAKALLPTWDEESQRKRNYLGYRLCGFSREEACRYVGMRVVLVTRWMEKDEAFAELENRAVRELRTELGHEIMALEFTRNMKLCLEKDRRVLDKAIDRPDTMSPSDMAYLHRIRPLYTAQTMQAVKGFFEADVGMAFDELILIARRHSQEASNAQAQTEIPHRGADSLPGGTPQYPQGTVIESWVTRREKAPDTETESLEGVA